MFLLKIPIVALFLIVRWAVRQTPEDGGRAGRRDRPACRVRCTRTTRARACRGFPAAGPTAIQARTHRARVRDRRHLRGPAAAPLAGSRETPPHVRIIIWRSTSNRRKEKHMSSEQSTVEAHRGETTPGGDGACTGRPAGCW